MFVNFTNHPSEKWEKNQWDAAYKYGEIIDVPFPSVDPEFGEEDISRLADEYSDKIEAMNPECVLCQGEFCLSYRVINHLKTEGYKVVAACSKRVAEENVVDGESVRISRFQFVQFREY